MNMTMNDIPGVDVTLPQRFWDKVTFTATCWLWTGATTGSQLPYGQLTVNRKHLLAHRVSYEGTGREIPDGLTLDHLCRTTLCVRPSHLEPVTRAENNHRNQAPAMVAWRLNQCLRGHALTPDNTLIQAGKRRCAVCTIRRRRLSTQRRIERREAQTQRITP